MTSTVLLIAAIMMFGAIMWVKLPEIGKRTKLLKAPPSFHARQAKLIFPLMALFVVLICSPARLRRGDGRSWMMSLQFQWSFATDIIVVTP